MTDAKGIDQVKEAVTFGATTLAMLRKLDVLDDRDRHSIEMAYQMLRKAEAYLYGFSITDEPKEGGE